MVIFTVIQKKLSYQNKKQQTKKIIFSFLFILILIITCIPIKAQSTTGGYAEMYLHRDYGTRPIALAGAYTAISDDPTTILYNPAGLSFYKTEPTIAAYVGSLGLGRTTSFLGYAQQIDDEFGIGFGIDGLYTGSFMGRDIKGNPLGEMANFQYCFTTAGSYRTEFASIGIGLKYLSNNLIGSYTDATGFALDIGTKFNVMDLFSFAIAVKNVYGQMFWNTQNYSSEILPFEIHTGIAMEFDLNSESYQTRSTVTGEVEDVNVPATKYLLASMDASFIEHSTSPSITLGIEALPDELIAFRAGLEIYGEKYGVPQLFSLNKWGAGVSLRPDIQQYIEGLPFKTQIDYTVANDFLNSSGISHHVSIIFNFE
jgi:hypothetical protein